MIAIFVSEAGHVWHATLQMITGCLTMQRQDALPKTVTMITTLQLVCLVPWSVQGVLQLWPVWLVPKDTISSPTTPVTALVLTGTTTTTSLICARLAQRIAPSASASHFAHPAHPTFTWLWSIVASTQQTVQSGTIQIQPQEYVPIVPMTATPVRMAPIAYHVTQPLIKGNSTQSIQDAFPSMGFMMLEIQFVWGAHPSALHVWLHHTVPDALNGTTWGETTPVFTNAWHTCLYKDKPGRLALIVPMIAWPATSMGSAWPAILLKTES